MRQAILGCQRVAIGTGRATHDAALLVAREGGGFVPGPVVGHRAFDGEKAPVVVGDDEEERQRGIGLGIKVRRRAPPSAGRSPLPLYQKHSRIIRLFVLLNRDLCTRPRSEAVSTLVGASLDCLAAVDDHSVPDNKGGRVRTQPEHSRCDFLRPTHPANWLLCDYPRQTLRGAAGKALHHGSVDDPGGKQRSPECFAPRNLKLWPS